MGVYVCNGNAGDCWWRHLWILSNKQGFFFLSALIYSTFVNLLLALPVIKSKLLDFHQFSCACCAVSRALQHLKAAAHRGETGKLGQMTVVWISLCHAERDELCDARNSEAGFPLYCPRSCQTSLHESARCLK